MPVTHTVYLTSYHPEDPNRDHIYLVCLCNYKVNLGSQPTPKDVTRAASSHLNDVKEKPKTRKRS